MKKKLQTLLSGLMLFMSASIFAVDATPESLVKTNEGALLDDAAQNKIAELEMHAAFAKQASTEAENAAKDKEIELKNLDIKNQEERKAIEDLTAQLTSLQKALEDAQIKQSMSLQETTAQQNIATLKKDEAHACSKEIAQLKNQEATRTSDEDIKKEILDERDSTSSQDDTALIPNEMDNHNLAHALEYSE